MSEWICPQTNQVCPANQLCETLSKSTQGAIAEVREQASTSQQNYIDTGEIHAAGLTLKSEGIMRRDENGKFRWFNDEEVKKDREQESPSPIAAADLSELRLRIAVENNLPFRKKEPEESDSGPYDSYDPINSLICLRGTIEAADRIIRSSTHDSLRDTLARLLIKANKSS